MRNEFGYFFGYPKADRGPAELLSYSIFSVSVDPVRILSPRVFGILKAYRKDPVSFFDVFAMIAISLRSLSFIFLLSHFFAYNRLPGKKTDTKLIPGVADMPKAAPFLGFLIGFNIRILSPRLRKDRRNAVFFRYAHSAPLGQKHRLWGENGSYWVFKRACMDV